MSGALRILPLASGQASAYAGSLSAKMDPRLGSLFFQCPFEGAGQGRAPAVACEVPESTSEPRPREGEIGLDGVEMKLN
jgi:hypothetical protein